MTVDTNLNFSDMVQKIYPDAKCFQWGEAYAIMDISDSAMSSIVNYNYISTNTVFYSKWLESPRLAWLDAWEKIQLKMLKKLEE